MWETREIGFETRIDGSFYNPLSELALDILTSNPNRKTTLANKDIVEKIILPGRFKRVYVKKDYGVPFLSGKDIVKTYPNDLKYISRIKTKKLRTYIIKEGWSLITCSGTMGRTALVTKEWDGWAATQHIIRIVPKNIHPGYVYAFLSSDYGQAQFSRFIHGSVVDEITDKQTEKVSILIPDNDIQNKIGSKTQKAFNLRSEANQIETTAIELIEEEIFNSE